MRISDWSSDVCSSDLPQARRFGRQRDGLFVRGGRAREIAEVEFRGAERGPRVGAGGFALCPRFEVGELVGWRGGGFAGRSGDGGGGIAPDRIADRRREPEEGGKQYHAISARLSPSIVPFPSLASEYSTG